jgi:hypothetical protein
MYVSAPTRGRRRSPHGAGWPLKSEPSRRAECSVLQFGPLPHFPRESGQEPEGTSVR